ncbi:cysteine--tRNA ligase [bacterium]|nr:cysteine--tRNA ligase [bacterium]
MNKPWLKPIFFDTLRAGLFPLATHEEGVVRMYHCGPTLYSCPTVGNWRSFLFSDVLKRTLEWGGWKVFQAMNITDVGHMRESEDSSSEIDPIQEKAKEKGLSPWDIVAHYEKQFFNDMDSLSMRRPTYVPKATEHIDDMVLMIRELIEKGYAYESNGNIYFSVKSFERYGNLSKNSIDNLDLGHRVDINADKRDARDFALWKTDSKHLMKWDTELGSDGFPGWHIECSAMVNSLFGNKLDIHSGGEDLIFPHHECEIAQSEAFSGKKLAKHWMHCRFLLVDGGKMGKSLGNAYTPSDIYEKGFTGAELRYSLIRGHYRQPLNFSFELLKDSRSALKRLQNFIQDLEEVKEVSFADEDFVKKYRDSFVNFMQKDLDVPQAIAVVMDLVKDSRKKGIDNIASSAKSFLSEVNEVLGIFVEQDDSGSQKIEEMIKERNKARDDRDWKKADRIREELLGLGVQIKDSSSGTTWNKMN